MGDDLRQETRRTASARGRPAASSIGLLLALSGCEGPADDPADPETVTCDSQEAVVAFETSDGVTLRADYRPAPEGERGAVVLFHMVPPQWDRTSWPERVREAFAAVGISVLNVDRRGAGESGGVPEDAYEGPGALLDMEAAVGFLVDPARVCPVDAARIALVGASNGTTPTLDYTVSRDASLPAPAALVWMSPGTYTENQVAIADHRDVLDPMPILWLYPQDEDWSDAFVPAAPATWEFVERGGEHGTRMFDEGELEDQTVADLVDWLATHAG